MARETEAPFHPIIYVRGYAGTGSEVEDTVATPYMGFNLGATKARQRWDGHVVRHVFESPLVRLMKDFGYSDVYSDGDDIPVERPIPCRSVVIYRYYDSASEDLGDGERSEIEAHAEGLDALIERVRTQVCANDGFQPEGFRVYLVAHSMGGLICRAFLQNHSLNTKAENRAAVDKVFTYATPHNGIDVRVIGNMPSFFTLNNKDNFNRARMRSFLDLREPGERADSLEGKFDPRRFFSLVGTNARDYDTAGGWAARAVGPISDGLVRIDNATVRGTPRAMVHRSHSGHYGIVNSEEGYQNLTRFLFGDVRVDGVLRVHELTLPARVQKALDEGKRVRASYHFETVVRPRGARYDLHRRLVGEASAIFREFDELRGPDARHPHLFSVYLATRHRTRKGAGPLVFAVDLAVKIPEYEVDRSWWPDLHVEGADLFHATIVVAAVPPTEEGGDWSVRYGSNATASDPTPSKAERMDALSPEGGTVFAIPIESHGRPGIRATLELTATPWS